MKILLIRLSSLGDIVLTEPVVRNLTGFYPQAEIFYLVKPAFKEVVLSFPQKVEIIAWHNDLASLIKLNRMKFDLVIDLHNKPNTALIRLFCSNSKKIVYDKQHHLRKLIVNKKTRETINSTLDLYFSVFNFLDLIPEFSYPQIEADNYPAPAENYILLFPGATSFTKRWQISNFAALADLLSADFQVVISGSSAETELCLELERSCNSKMINICGKTSLSELASIISQAKAIIANDSGPAHLAAALNIPLAVIFGGTSPKLGFAPLGDRVKIISRDLDCSPCSLHGRDKCPQKQFNCMAQISAAEVYAVVQDLIRK
ncbi:MAG: glycosyltransferase family 9 protein [Candidatus Cloacimonetes bacterium]|nr:glycosyltransferase family 9 protein [Candidatus Cloacimonadota bacterium]